jgi:dsDNA-binding SOS-regulon protein|tara:strand:- start:143 stop:364 length:222 start_codon:yes stop_codon:yes gene_type:complete
MLDLSYMIPDMTTERTEERRNRFTNKREFLTKEEADLHDKVFYHEALEQWDQMLKVKDKFSRLNPKAYMTLLD